MSPTASVMNAPLMPWYIAAAIGAAGLLMVLRPGRNAIRHAGAVIGLAGFGLLLAEGLKLAGPAEGSLSTPFLIAFAAVGVIGAVRVITHPRPVFAAIYFILTVLAAASTFLVLDAEFLAFALIIVYAGAILITYLFVLMLAHQSPEDEAGRIGAEDYDRVPREPFVAVALGFFLLAALGSAIERAPEMALENASAAPARVLSRQAAALQAMPATMLAQAKAGMKFKDPKNDTWVLEESTDVSKAGSQAEKTSQQAMMLLNRVVEQHPGTPWAVLAAEELKRPLGYAWVERHTGVNEPKKGGGGGGGGEPGARPDDKKRMLAAPKPKRPLKNL